MPKGNITTVDVSKTGQFRTTIPRPIAEAMGLEKGTKLEWIVEGKSILKVRVLREER